jgi:hypothetical protein
MFSAPVLVRQTLWHVPGLPCRLPASLFPFLRDALAAFHRYFDILEIDAEGMDFDIIKSMDFNRFHRWPANT